MASRHRFTTTIAALASVLLFATSARAAVKVVATTEDLAAIAREVGGNRVEVTALAKGYQDPHFVEPKPSFILAVSRADLLLVVGRELEIGWLPTLITSSRNAKIQPGAAGYLDASLTVKILEIPTGQITRAMGDVHPQGNPHYWLDPANGRRMAAAIRDRLTQMDGAGKATFDARYADFDKRLAAAEQRWNAAMAPFRGAKLVTYHRSWPNLMERWGLVVMGYVEPKPGIPPSPSHTLQLIADMKSQGVKLIVVEPYFDKKTPQSVAAQVGGEVLELAPSVGSEKSVTDYIALFDYNVGLLQAALKRSTGR
jgi:zinc/manganese transport system substrate-binding protein